MDGHRRLRNCLEREIDDVLSTLQLVEGDAALEAHLFDRLVDLFVEAQFAELRAQRSAGDLDEAIYYREVRTLVERCAAVGLLPQPSRRP